VDLFTILLRMGQKYYKELLVPQKLAEILHLITITMKPKIYKQNLRCRKRKYTHAPHPDVVISKSTCTKH